MIFIGIDPGTTTGYGIWDATRKQFMTVGSDHMLKVMNLVLYHCKGIEHMIIIEDARMRKKFDKSDWNPKKYQGVGSVKRDCKLWEDFCSQNELDFVMKHPRNTKMNADTFKRLTKWEGSTNSHMRDSAMIVFGMSDRKKLLISNLK